jgi:hypothetical protein
MVLAVSGAVSAQSLSSAGAQIFEGCTIYYHLDVKTAALLGVEAADIAMYACSPIVHIPQAELTRAMLPFEPGHIKRGLGPNVASA